MRPIKELTSKELEKIKLVVFDVDGVLVPRGTKIKQEGNTTTLETKVVLPKQIEQIKNLHKKGFHVNISSGRGLYMLQEMFRDILPFVSLTCEIGSITWYHGQLYQHINSFDKLFPIIPKLKAVKNSKIKGFEPKEFIITIHCEDRIQAIEDLVSSDPNLYTVWNGEAYDIGINAEQHKALGLRHVIEIFGLKKENVLAIGDNYNDKELLDEAGIAVSADKTRVEGDFFVPLEGEFLPADLLMQHILSLK